MATGTRARVFRATSRNIALLAAALRNGELVAVPTETVYGLAADALNPSACRGIFRAKGRPTHDPLIVHLHSLDQVQDLAEPNELVAKVAKAFWPGPLTIVLPKKPIVPEIVTSGRPSVALRMPSHPAFRRLLKACGRPLAAPSANRFGYVSPTTADHVMDGLGERIRYILDGGPCQIGLESTILDLRDAKRPAILRPGAIERADLERVLARRVSAPRRQTHRANSGAIAPGLLSKHYSPRTPVVLHKKINAREVGAAAGEAYLVINAETLPGGAGKNGPCRALSRGGDLAEVAHGLFAALRELDRGKHHRIHVELAPGRSALALAINDRLSRAAAKR
jgi:L-threonylcarbamoyladenylate synthase